MITTAQKTENQALSHPEEETSNALKIAQGLKGIGQLDERESIDCLRSTLARYPLNYSTALSLVQHAVNEDKQLDELFNVGRIDTNKINALQETFVYLPACSFIARHLDMLDEHGDEVFAAFVTANDTLFRSAFYHVAGYMDTLPLDVLNEAYSRFLYLNAGVVSTRDANIYPVKFLDSQIDRLSEIPAMYLQCVGRHERGASFVTLDRLEKAKSLQGTNFYPSLFLSFPAHVGIIDQSILNSIEDARSKNIACSYIDCLGEISPTTQHDLSERYPNYFYNLDRVANLDLESIDYENLQKFGPSAIEFGFAHWRFELVAKYVELGFEQQVKELATKVNLAQLVNQSFSNKNYGIARAAYSLLSKLGLADNENFTFNPAELVSLPIDEVPCLEPYQQVNVSRSAVHLYIAEELQGQLRAMELALGEPQEMTSAGLRKEPLEFKSLLDRSSVDSISKYLAQELHNNTDWALHYLVYAVMTELGHTSNGNEHGNVPPMKIDYSNVLNMTREELHIFFHQAKASFSDETGWEGSSYGGMAWASIAELGEFVTESPQALEERRIYLMDRMFDLEHNTGLIFDKDLRLHSHSLLPQVLDAHASAESTMQLVEYYFRLGLLTEPERSKYVQIQTELKRLSTAQLRTKGYE
jgi:hypothetical protein